MVVRSNPDGELGVSFQEKCSKKEVRTEPRPLHILPTMLNKVAEIKTVCRIDLLKKLNKK
jgi:hypothetical protein